MTNISEQNKLYDINTVSTAPEFPGGPQALAIYISTHLKYPTEAKENNIEGKVYIGFVIEKDGSLSNLEVINGIDGGCNEEAMRVLRNSPLWKPGTFNGNPVRTTYTLPITFRLADHP
jgi:TonB family protein